MSFGNYRFDEPFYEPDEAGGMRSGRDSSIDGLQGWLEEVERGVVESAVELATTKVKETLARGESTAAKKATAKAAATSDTSDDEGADLMAYLPVALGLIGLGVTLWLAFGKRAK